MSYNIDSVTYIGATRLTITKEALAEAEAAVPEDDRAECTFIHELDPEAEKSTIEKPWWYGQWSGRNFEGFMKALSFTQGIAGLVVCWEGGDSYTGLLVVNGKVTKHAVIFSLGEALDG
jgi:hypothetical protein